MLPKRAIEEMVSRVDNRVLITAEAGDTDTYSLAVYEQIVEVDSTLGTLTVYLPDVAEAAGLVYSITAKTGATKTVTVTEKASGNSYDFPSDPSLNADLDRVLLASDGKRWWIVTDQYT